MIVNTEDLRKDLIDYFTSAMFLVSPTAIMDVEKVEQANSKELIEIAQQCKFDINKYIIN